MNAARCRARRSCISIIAASSRALVDIDVSTRSTFGQAGSHVKTHVNDAVSVTPDSFRGPTRSEEHTSELQSLMRISYAVFCLKKTKHTVYIYTTRVTHKNQHVIYSVVTSLQ